MKESKDATNGSEPEAIPLTPGVEVERPLAWEMIETGRYPAAAHQRKSSRP